MANQTLTWCARRGHPDCRALLIRLVLAALCVLFALPISGPQRLSAAAPEIADSSNTARTDTANAATDREAPHADEAAQTVDFNRDIRPILSNKCFICHGPDEAERQAGLRLDRRDSATRPADSGATAIVPGQVEESELVRRIHSEDGAERMPPTDAGKQLSPKERELLTRWVAAGAPYALHWSYVPPVRPQPPSRAVLAQRIAATRFATNAESVDPMELPDWPANEVDYFVLARMLEEGVAPSPRADRATLVRRVALDLTGLPPTPAEAAAVLHDARPDAYERWVDCLLEKPAFGEHWARKWLDLARYADSTGYADDPPRTIWAYRDYVIRAFNENKPFDLFTIEQLAGDLLPNPTQEQLIATAFHRNTQTNNEGGTNDEEYRNVAIVDRVNTTMAVWMGTTMACAQCHSHKYDPITQEDYFRFFAILNNCADADRRDEDPVLEVWSEPARERRLALESELRRWEAIPDEERTTDHAARIETLRKELGDLQPTTTVPILRELAGAERRVTHIQFRGNFLDTGPAVQPGLPEAFCKDKAMADGCDRLALARWLVDPKNPLTARVIANRYWEAIFGRGIVLTSEDFGSQGELPTHPELLDWLGTELMDSGWDIKAFLKKLVLSATYQQDSRVRPDQWERDPDNAFLARGPRFRLSAEMVRDQALAVSGLLSSKMYGPPVHPMQPSLGLSAAFGGGIDWKTSEGEDRYRRAIYTTWRRSNPYPSMATFDAPNREVCTVRRDRTNTPLQALVTLNDPVYVEAAQALARAIIVSAATDTEKARFGFERCLVRKPTDKELAALVSLHDEALRRYATDAEAARQMATEPLGDVAEGTSVADLAAWTVVSNVLLNLDEMLMKR